MSVKDYKFPKDRKYWINHTPSHLWLKESGEGIVTVGVTDFFTKRIGKFTSITLKAQSSPSSPVIAEKTMGLVKAKNYSAILKYPISGKIMVVNENIIKKPKQVNKSSYDKGWLIQVRPEPDYSSQLSDNIVSTGEELDTYINQELKNNALQADDCCPDFLGGSGVVRRRKPKS